MDTFAYREDTPGEHELYAEGIALSSLAKQVGTPLYVYSSGALTARYQALADALPDALICYSVKANGNVSVIRSLARLGAGADVVSGGELKRALAAGVPPHRIVFAGVGKTEDEMAAALDAGILQINVESEPELEQLSRVATVRGVVAPVAVRINPDVDAKTHDKIATGRKFDKFGIAHDLAADIYNRVAELPGVEAVGIAVHIGSQLTTLEPFDAAFAKLGALTRTLKGLGHDIRRMDFGGGLGIGYEDDKAPPLADYAALVRATAAGVGCEAAIEPGRFIAGPAGVLLTRVLYVKRTEERVFVIVDAAMNDLLRPSLYDAWHQVQPVTTASEEAQADWETVDIVGPVCESGDVLARSRKLPPLAPGDLLAIRDAGAYGAVMASAYNSRPPAGEVLVRGDSHAVVRPRASIEEMIAGEPLPPWLA